VVATRADGGFAYDGDGDRVAMVDETGQPVFADRLIALLAGEALVAHPGGTVVYELSCTQALAETVEELGGTAISCPVGYAFVHDKVRASGALLGGESAGHIFFGDPDFRFDDALLATAKLAALLARSGEPLSVLLAKLPHYVRATPRRFHCPDEIKGQVIAHAADQLASKGYEIERLDGVKVHAHRGWGLYRASNTQPAVTLHCEAPDKVLLSEIEALMLDTVRDSFSPFGVELNDAH
jgi:phosphomannomutase/phosphoglucomutase